MNRKANCWEYMKCGREPMGAAVQELGVCAAATEEPLDGIHGGRMAGRACWAVAGTLCRGEVQGTFAEKIGSCKNCDFYRLVWEEEVETFVTIGTLARMLKEKTAG